MTDRFAGFVVTLERDLREDDAAATIAAIKQIKGVIGVQPLAASYEQHIAEQRVRFDLEKRLWNALEDRPES